MGPKPTPKKAPAPKKKAEFVGPPPKKRAPKTPTATPAPSKVEEPEEKDEF
jgi:hypothetical protein